LKLGNCVSVSLSAFKCLHVPSISLLHLLFLSNLFSSLPLPFIIHFSFLPFLPPFTSLTVPLSCPSYPIAALPCYGAFCFLNPTKAQYLPPFLPIYLSFSLPPSRLSTCFILFSSSSHPFFISSFLHLLFILLCASLLCFVPNSGATVLQQFLPPCSGPLTPQYANMFTGLRYCSCYILSEYTLHICNMLYTNVLFGYWFIEGALS
jgi:hypothetical protein